MLTGPAFSPTKQKEVRRCNVKAIRWPVGNFKPNFGHSVNQAYCRVPSEMILMDNGKRFRQSFQFAASETLAQRL
jgi:hypothetical protein